MAVIGRIQKPAVYIVDPYHDAAITKLKEQLSLDLILPDDPRKEDFLDHATAVLVRSETTIDAESIRRAHSGLKYIIKQGVGVDNIDIAAAQEKGIQVFNTPVRPQDSQWRKGCSEPDAGQKPFWQDAGSDWHGQYRVGGRQEMEGSHGRACGGIRPLQQGRCLER